MIFEDNHACAKWSENDGLDHTRTKHIDIRYHMIRDNVKKMNISVELCPTQEMVADIMTKPLGPDLHERTSLKMMGYTNVMSRPGDKLSGALIRGELSSPESPTSKKPGVLIHPSTDDNEPIPVDYVELVMAAAAC